jgi:WD40 repeat protein
VLFSATGGSWKIADFGLTSEGGSAALVTTRSAYGKPGYRPPEMIIAPPFRYNNKADIWCVGCIIFELFTGERPFHDDISVVDHARSENNLEERIWARVESRPYLGRYINLLDPDPNNRPSAIELKLMVKKDLDRFEMALSGTNMDTKSDRINSDPGWSEGKDRTPSPLEIPDESDDEVNIVWGIDVGEPKDLTVSHLQAYDVGGGVHTVKFSTDGTYLAVSTLWNVQIFDTTRNAKISTFWAADSGQKMVEGVVYFSTVCFTPDNARLVSSGESEKISIWDIRRKRFGNYLLGHSDNVNSVDVSLDGIWLASGSEDQTVKVWNLDTGGIVRTIHLWEAVRSVAFSPCFQTLIGGTIGGTVYVWSLKSGCITQKLEEHHDNVGGLAFLSNGSELVSASDDNTLRVWKLSPVTDKSDRVDGTLTDWESCRAELVGHRKQVTSVTTSPNGKWIASGSMDKSVWFWNTDDGKGYKTLRFHVDGMLQNPVVCRLMSISSICCFLTFANKKSPCDRNRRLLRTNVGLF